jgi:RHS repeat-associated protein
MRSSLHIHWLVRSIAILTLLKVAIAPQVVFGEVGCWTIEGSNCSNEPGPPGQPTCKSVPGSVSVDANDGLPSLPSGTSGGGSGGQSDCSSCGGGSGFGGSSISGDISADQLNRIWLPTQQTANSSFTPGFFSQFDRQIQVFPVSGGASIDFFSPGSGLWHHFVDGLDGDPLDGAFHDLKRNTALKFELLDANNAVTTNVSAAVTAVVTYYTGGSDKFQLIDLNADPNIVDLAGRLTQRKDREGRTLQLNYKTWTPAQIAASPSRQWQLDTVADGFGNTLTFTYSATQYSGRWVVSQVARQDGKNVSFTYANNKLTTVTFADGSTTSYAYSQNSGNNNTVVTVTEAQNSSRSGAYQLANDFTGGSQTGTLGFRVPGKALEQTSLGGELLWRRVLPINPADDMEMIITGPTAKVYYGNGNRRNIDSFTETGPGGGVQNAPSNKIQYVVAKKRIAMFVNYDVTLDSVIYGASATQAQLDKRQIPLVTDEQNRQRSYLYDTASNPTKTTYNADNTFEHYTYNSFSQVTRARSRNGNVKLTTYDAAGRKLTDAVGLIEQAGQDVQTAAYAVTNYEYYPVGHASAGLLKAVMEPLYNAGSPTLHRTDYEYNSQGQVTKVIGPASASGQARPETVSTYTAGLLSSVTDPLGRITNFQYDNMGRRTQTTYPDTSTEQTLYGTGATTSLPAKTKDRMNNVTTYIYDTSARLSQVVVGTAIDANILDGQADSNPITDPNLKNTTTYAYVPGSLTLKSSVTTNGSKTDYIYNIDSQLLEVKQYPRVGLTLISKKSYLNNELFYDEDPYGRRKYYGYRASDGTLIRTVTATVPSFTLADYTAVWNLTRSTTPNATHIIHDAIRDSDGQLTQVIDGRNIETRYEYDSRGRETKKTAAFGTSLAAVTETSYDLTGKTTEVRMPRYFDSSDTEGFNKAKENWTYDGAGRVLTHTEAAGSPVAATESFTYFADGRQQTHTDYRGKVWTNIDDTCCGKSTASKNPLGHGSIRNTDPARRVIHTATVANVDTSAANMLDPVNANTLAESTTKYDNLGRTVATTTWLTTRGSIDPLSPPIAGLGGVPAADGLTTQYLYDNNLSDGVGLDSAAGVTYTRMVGSGTSTVKLSNAISKLASAQTSGGAGISFNTTSPARASVVISPQDEVSFTISDAAGRTVMSGKLDNYTGTANNLLSWSSQLNDAVVNIAGFGNCLESRSIDALGKDTRTLSDGAGRTIQSIDQLSKITLFTYDAGGNQLSVRDPNNVGQDVVYDALGRAGLTTDTASHTTNSSYDKAGNRIAAIDGKSQTTSYLFDARGRQKSQTDRLSGVTSYTYLATGQLASLTDAQNQVTSYTYDDAGGKLTETYPDHTSGTPSQTTYGIVTFVLDEAGRVKRKQDQKGDTCIFNYDLAGRLGSRDYRTAANSPSGTIADTDSFVYDKAGRMTTANSQRYANTVGYTYDSAGRKKTEYLTISGQTYTTTTGYNSRGELNQYTYPDGAVVGRSYTDRGELYQLTHAGTTIDTRVYDVGGRQTTSTYNNGVVETRAYNTDNTLASISFGGSGSAIGNMTYGWDNNHNKTSETIAGTMANYGFSIPTGGYDNEDRLVSFNRTSGLTQSWNLSLVGDWNSVTTNGTAQTRTHGPTHELLTGAGQAVSTDVKGNITAIPAGLRPNAASLTSVWDFDNRLSSATTGSTTVSHKYDALGRRVAHTVGSMTTVFVHCGQRIFVDYILGSTPASSTYRYVYAKYIDEPVMRWQRSNNSSTYYHRNDQFSIVALTNSTGTTVERYAYSGYGVPTIASGTGTTLSATAYNNRYLYTGREWDSDLQQYHFRFRVYDPELGRFTRTDPSGYRDGQNLFGNYFSPSKTDPLGLEALNYRLFNCYHNTPGVKRCVFPMYSGPDDVDDCFIEQCGGGVLEDKIFDAKKQKTYTMCTEEGKQEILKKIKDSGCCEIIFAGHQGAGKNIGGVCSYPESGEKKPCPVFPNKEFENQLSLIMKQTCKSGCNVYQYSCGGSDPGNTAPGIQQNIANNIGCTFWATQRGVDYEIMKRRDRRNLVEWGVPCKRNYSIDPKDWSKEGNCRSFPMRPFYPANE